MYYEFKVKDKTYKLKLRTRDIIEVEKRLGCTVLMVFGAEFNKIPTLETCAVIIHASMQKYEHNIKYNDVLDIIDEYLEDHTTPELVEVLIGIYSSSGIIPKPEEEKELDDPGKN